MEFYLNSPTCIYMLHQISGVNSAWDIFKGVREDNRVWNWAQKRLTEHYPLLARPQGTMLLLLSPCLSVSPSVSNREPLIGFSRNFYIAEPYRSLPKNSDFGLKSDKNTRHFTWRPTFRFCAHFERNSLNVHGSEKCFKQMLWRNMERFMPHTQVSLPWLRLFMVLLRYFKIPGVMSHITQRTLPFTFFPIHDSLIILPFGHQQRR
jgi:hypothetical protein